MHVGRFLAGSMHPKRPPYIPCLAHMKQTLQKCPHGHMIFHLFLFYLFILLGHHMITCQTHPHGESNHLSTVIAQFFSMAH